jgi:drug/metabolite transporter (DMT)-like permease
MYSNSLVAGICFTLAAVLCFALHFLLEPRTIGYPKAPKFVLINYFAFALVLFYMGTSFFSSYFFGPPSVPPQAQPKTVMMALALIIHKGVMVTNILRQHLPPQVWARLEAINEKVRCSEGKCAVLAKIGIR